MTGAIPGLGKRLSRMLCPKNGSDYVTARSEQKASKAMPDIKTAVPESAGALHSRPTPRLGLDQYISRALCGGRDEILCPMQQRWMNERRDGE